MRVYLMRNTADASIKCCGLWLHVRGTLIGIAPSWWWTDRRQKGPRRVLGISLLMPGAWYDKRILFSVVIGRREFGWRRDRLGQHWRLCR